MSPSCVVSPDTHVASSETLQVSFYIPQLRSLLDRLCAGATLPLCREPGSGKAANRERARRTKPTRRPMSKFNNKFSFYMLMFCGTGTIFNLVLLNFGKWGV